jgi:hypothetical protein
MKAAMDYISGLPDNKRWDEVASVAFLSGAHFRDKEILKLRLVLAECRRHAALCMCDKSGQKCGICSVVEQYENEERK